MSRPSRAPCSWLVRGRPAWLAASLVAASLVAASLVAVSLVGVSAARAQDAAPTVDESAFVRVSGTSFTLRGVPWHFLGANVAVVHGPLHRSAMERTLDAVRDDGLSVVRVWALGERPAGALPYTREYAFRTGEDGWIETSFVHLDRVLAAARARGLRVIVVLANRWSDYGGFPRYLRWAGLLPETTDARELTELEVARFYSSTRCDSLYRAHVTDVSRVHVWLGGVELGVLVAPVDDGRGAWLELAVQDEALLERAFGGRSRVHELRLRVDADQAAGGLCLYEQDFEHPEAPPGRVELSWQARLPP